MVESAVPNSKLPLETQMLQLAKASMPTLSYSTTKRHVKTTELSDIFNSEAQKTNKNTCSPVITKPALRELVSHFKKA